MLVRANPNAPITGIARELLTIASQEPNRLVLSEAILVEVERVFEYPRLVKRWPAQERWLPGYLRRLRLISDLISLPPDCPSIVSDPDDDPVLHTAILGKADILCTRDLAFYEPSVAEYCRAHGIRVMDDIATIQFLRSQI